MNHSMGYTPFFVVYASEVVIPSDLDFDAPCVHFYDKQRAEEQHQTNVDMHEEVQNTAVVRSASYQQGLCRYHTRRVHDRSFIVGDLILQRATPSKRGHKLSPSWEGPFRVSWVIRLGTYRISTIAGKEYDNAWKIKQRRRFYP